MRTPTKEKPTIYAVDGTVTGDWTVDNWPRPEAGYGSSFATVSELREWWGESFAFGQEGELFTNWLINKNLIQYESSVSGYVMNYKLYDVPQTNNYWLDCVNTFSAECWKQRLYASVEQVIGDYFQDQTDCFSETDNNTDAAECLTREVCGLIASFIK